MGRAFQGLRRRGPLPRYDAVVVGAGIGGLVCANLLAEAGLQVLLVEQHYMAGGFCSTFRRGGYTFDASTHFYPLVGNPATFVGRLLRRLGVATEWVKMDPVDTFHFPDGTSFDVPADFDAYLARVKERFPEEARGLDAFFADARAAYALGLLAYFREHRAPGIERFQDWTVAQALDRHIRDPRLRLLLTADCPHWGSPPCRTSFVFDSMLRLAYFLGNYYPVGGSQAFADELARAFEARGGEILMSTTVERILDRDGRAHAVEMTTTRGRLAGRYRVEAGAIVSNADLRLTLERLLRPEVVPPELLAEVRRLRPSHPCYLSHLGLRGITPERLAPLQGYYWQGWDADRMGDGALRCKVFVPTLYEPLLAPDGGQVVILQKVRAVDYRGVADWSAHKADFEAYVYEHLERLIPDLGAHVVTHSSATANTAWRFTLNHRGAMLGWEMSPDQLGDGRPATAGPLRDLHFVGHWTRPGGGIVPVLVSALQVAERIAAAAPRGMIGVGA